MNKIRFKSTDNKFSAEITDEILNDIHGECIKSNDTETGGIIIGKYSEDRSNAIISSITGPPNDSKQGKCTFEIGVSGLDKILEDNLDLGYRCIGDWHFHPNSSPRPSIIDDMQMKKFACNKPLNCPEPILLIIGGNQDKGWELSLHVYTKDSKISLKKQK
ncbi:MAG: Mov34/MPN/PAD-1 family protein [Euryarchaeota archaeon]|nr:Mov34/MPN/PAD-1 family protein [Euryarchaeota archaeon]MBU4547786.1 Mov34/MPN/PAD-1 family protein [Euryarchaeota archaeon]MBV1730041.1 Mov34/MPN/PAD-1 family protein [Methanobacterium sp.]MBV1754492.1 Mov34/MPN/PAD-1 family protein [Methanobacterium sp.]MBV1768376.1 Mov34/MPN/PAD-1 family protein [Methanobacterium sp.]